MGVNDEENERIVNLNLQESNFISLNTPIGSSGESSAIQSYKKTGDKILFYIKLFFKNKNKSHKLRFHTRRNKHHAANFKRTSKSKRMSTSKINGNSSVGRNKTHKTGAFMRV